MGDSYEFLWTENGGGISTGPNRASDNTEFYLRSLIYAGQLAPGDKLPPEKELSRLLGIATATLRAALRSLEIAGLIVITRGTTGGSRVSDVGSLTQRWNEWMVVHRDQLPQMLEYTRFLQLQIASLAALRWTPADLQAIESAAHAAMLSYGESKTFTEGGRGHVRFLDALSRSAHNEYFQRALTTIRGELFIPVNPAVYVPSCVALEGVVERVLAAVKDRDSERAVREMSIHVELTEQLFFRVDRAC